MDEWSGEFELVNPREIIIDHRYQRAEKPDLIATISASPEWAAFGAISCFKRNNMYVCIDGQQRLRGVLSADKPPRLVPVIVHAPAAIEQEARTFVKVNVVRKAVDQMEKHRGQLVATDPFALALERAVEKAGFTIGYGEGSAEHQRSCVAPLHLQLARRGGRDERARPPSGCVAE